MLLSDSLNKSFPEFEPELKTALESEGQMRTIPAGTELMRTGQFIRSTGLVLDGLVKVYREDGEGNEFFMYYLQPGDGCALSMTCLVASQTSSISAVAEKDTEMLMIPLDKMDEWMNQYKTWYQFVIRSYRSRFDELLNLFDQVAFRNMDERLEFYLKRKAKTLNTRHLNITHSEIAQDLNSSREVISRLLKKLSERGLVRINRYHIELLSL